MRKLIAVGVLVGGLLAGGGWGQQAQAATTFLQPQGGLGDPLTLAASGVLIPFLTSGPLGTVALIELASPVGYNDSPALHLIFYNNTCVRAESVELELTINDIAFVNPAFSVVSATNGLVAIGGIARDPITGNLDHLRIGPLENPIHSRVYEFNPSDGRSRVFEPIIVDTAEFGVDFGFTEKTWSPLRTAATFFAPFETATVKTQLTLICPRTSIQGAVNAAFGDSTTQLGPGFSSTGFPLIFPPFWTVTGGVLQPMQGVIYNTEEEFIADISFTCDCLNPDVPLTVLSPAGAYSFVSSTLPDASHGTYTEFEVVATLAPATPNASPGSFTGYKASFTVGSALNNFFGRLSNGNRTSIAGTILNER